MNTAHHPGRARRQRRVSGDHHHEHARTSGVMTCPNTRAKATLSKIAGVLHFIPDEDDPESCVHAFTSHMVPGSFLAVSHISSDGISPAAMAAVHRAYRTASAPAVFRSREEIARFFIGVELVEPGLTNIAAWRANGTESQSPANLVVLCGLGRKR
jgi:hypothetical protein